MITSIDCIVLSKLKYKESDLIIKCYSKQKGLISYILKGVLTSKKNKKTGYYQLLSQLNLETDYKTNRTLHYVKDVKNNILYTSLHSDIYKSAIVMFIAEVLTIALKEEEQNDSLYSYIEATLEWLDLNDDFANFHLLFLLNLSKYLGFYPDTSILDFNFFCLREGKFQYIKNNELTLFGEDVILLKQLLGTTFDDLNQIKINAKQRFNFLTHLLKYYELHLHGFKKPKSLQILNAVFN